MKTHLQFPCLSLYTGISVDYIGSDVVLCLTFVTQLLQER